MLKSQIFALLITASLMATGCSKKAETSPATASVAQPAATSVAASSQGDEQDPELLRKSKAVAFALMEENIKNDPKGQWAVTAKASSTYASNPDDSASDYHPARATGAPDTQTYGDYGTAWATKDADAGVEWIELEYAKPVNATQVKIRQSNAPGAIIRVDLYDEAGTIHNLWQGPDTTKYDDAGITWLDVPFEKTTYKTQRVKITLATNAVSGWNEIDAVQLVGE